MLNFGLACSHAAGLFRPPEVWSRHLDRVAAGVLEQFPNAKAERESLEYAQQLHRRIHQSYTIMREKMAEYKPDALIMIGDDQGDMFNTSNNPALAIYTGTEELWGRTAWEWDKPAPEREKVLLKPHVELSRFLLTGLIKRDFDLANMGKFVPAGKPGVGLSHMASRIVPLLDPTMQIPVVCIFINEYFAPMPSAKRCARLGEAIADILKDRPERIAICASGGLSHYPGRVNAGFVDEPLDRWVLERIERNDVQALEHLFAFDSHSMRSGMGETRAWVSVAAAMNRPGTVIDYMPVHSAYTGAGFAYWPEKKD